MEDFFGIDVDALIVAQVVQDLVDQTSYIFNKQSVFQNDLIMDKVFNGLDMATIKNSCRLAFKDMEKVATRHYTQKTKEFLVLQQIYDCCASGPIPTLYNPLMATRVMTWDNCQQLNIFHTKEISLHSSSKIFMNFCKKYHGFIKDIVFISLSDQYCSLREVLTVLGFPVLRTLVMHVTNASSPSQHYERMFALSSRPTVELLILQRNLGFKPSGAVLLFENLIASSRNLKKLVLADYLYPRFDNDAYQLLTELVYDVSPFLINTNTNRPIVHDLFLLQEIRRVLQQLGNVLEKLTLISSTPLNYGSLFGNGETYSRILDPRPFDPLLPVMPRLQFLNIQHSEYYILTQDELASSNLPALETLKITRATGLRNRLVKLFVTDQFLSGPEFTGNSTLTNLHLEGVISSVTITRIHEKFPALTRLFMKMYGSLLWNCQSVFDEIGKMSENLRHLELYLPPSTSNAELAADMQQSYHDWYLALPAVPTRLGFLGLETCVISVHSRRIRPFDNIDFVTFTLFLSEVTRSMQRMEFRNIIGSYQRARDLLNYVRNENLPVFFTDSD